MKNSFQVCFLPLALVLIGCVPSGTTTQKDAPGGASAESTPRKTVGKTTQNVLALDQARADGGILASTEIESKNPLLVNAEAYRTTVGKLGGMSVEKAIQIRNAQSIQDPKPMTHEVMMKEIIKKGQPGGIRLPMLPYYQEYAWDEEQQKLVVVEFPARQAEREQQR